MDTPSFLKLNFVLFLSQSPQGIESLLPFTLPNKAYNTLHKSNYSLQFQSMVWVIIYLPIPI